MHCHARAAAARPPIDRDSDLVSWIEPCSGLIRVVGRGPWSEAQVAVHFAALRNLIKVRRDAGELVRVMVDLRESDVQDLDTATRIGDGTMDLYGERDRVALIVESSTLRAQLKNIIEVENLAYFLSPTAARIWLGAMWLSAPPAELRRPRGAVEESRWLMAG
jgi:hypothetical protein